MRTRLLTLMLATSLGSLAPSAQAQFLFGRVVPPPPETEANGASTAVDVSSDGKVLAFVSGASNWIAGSNPVGCKVIAVDLARETVESLAFTSAGVALNANCFDPVPSHDGRFVAFTTQSDNLDVGVATSGSQIVRKDRVTSELLLVSANAAGVPVSQSAGGQAHEPSISGDGRYVVFRSDESDLVAGDLAGTDDVFVKDLATGRTGAVEAISLDANGNFTSAGTLFLTSHSISADGRYVVFQSTAANIVAGVGSNLGLVYVRDVESNSTEIASLASGGAIANSQSELGAISPSGRFVSFRSFATNLVAESSGSAVFVRDRNSDTTTKVPLPSVDGAVANGCRESDVSDAGSVILACFFPNSIPDQVFLHVPGAAGTPFLISSDTNDVRGNQRSAPSLAVDASGLSMAFESLASNLVIPDGNVAADSNGVSDVFFLADAELLSRIFSDGFED